MEPLSKCIHAFILIVYSYGLYFDHYNLVIPANTNSSRMTYKVIGGRWKYLTYIDLVRIQHYAASRLRPNLFIT